MALLCALGVALLPAVAWFVLCYSISHYVASGISKTKLKKPKGESDA